MQELLVRKLLEKALLKRKIHSGLIVHSNSGGQYLSDKNERISAYFWTQTEQPSHGMSRADDPYDNAFAESRWSRLKTERPSHGWKCLRVVIKT